MKFIYQLEKYASAIIIMGSLLITGCSKDDKVENEPVSQPVSITGEWYEEVSNNDVKHILIASYDTSGGVNVWEAYADNSYIPTTYSNSQGKYTYDGSNLSLSLTNSTSGNETQEFKVRELTKYNLIEYYEPTASTDELHRIVDTYKMTVGEKKTVTINDSEFSATSYKSNDTGVVTVDGAGTISATKRGTAYIIVSSSIGKAIIRVIVEDPDNYFDDGLRFLGSQPDSLTTIYGNMYRGDSFGDRHYNLIDDVVLYIKTTFADNEIINVTIRLRDDANIDLAIESLRKKYVLEYEFFDDVYFSTIKNSRTVSINLNKGSRTIEYLFDDFYDNL